MLKNFLSRQMTLFHWWPVPHQHYYGFLDKYLSKPQKSPYFTQLHELGSNGPQRSFTYKVGSWSIVPLHQLGSWPTTSLTSLYESSPSKDSMITIHIKSLVLIETASPIKAHLHRMTSKLMVICPWQIILYILAHDPSSNLYYHFQLNLAQTHG